MKEDIIIGIDPDVDKSGVAIFNRQEKRLELKSLDFPNLCKYLTDFKSYGKSFIVLIEAGWINRSNWHLSPRMTVQKAAQIGNATGRNHETGRKLAEMCAFWGVPYKLIKPLRKVWRGTEGKISATEFRLVTGYAERTNQEERDAGLIAWFY